MANLATWTRHDYKDDCPVDGEQQVEVMWRDGTTTKHRAGVFNWDMVAAYKILPNRPHAQ